MILNYLFYNCFSANIYIYICRNVIIIRRKKKNHIRLDMADEGERGENNRQSKKEKLNVIFIKINWINIIVNTFFLFILIK